jgi:3-oxoacyl-[acyl-carrier-protein] synthase-3
MQSTATLPGVGPSESAAAPHTSRIEAVGLALPERRLPTDEFMASRRHRFPLDLEARTGIRERRECAEDEDTLTLAVDAARDCLSYSGYQAPELDMVVSCSISRHDGDRSVGDPPFSLAIKEALGARDALNFDVSNACAGMLTGVHVLDNFIRRGAVRRGLVVSGEFITDIARNASQTAKTITSNQLASLTLGDAGAAVIMDRNPDGGEGVLASDIVTFARYRDLCVAGPSDDAPGNRMETDTALLHRAAIANSPAFMVRIVERFGIAPSDVDFLIPHQTAKPAIDAGIKHTMRRFKGWSGEVVYNVEDFGNTASTTHFAALYRLLREGRLQATDRVAMLVSASGLTIGGMVFTVGALGEKYGRAA